MGSIAQTPPYPVRNRGSCLFGLGLEGSSPSPAVCTPGGARNDVSPVFKNFIVILTTFRTCDINFLLI